VSDMLRRLYEDDTPPPKVDPTRWRLERERRVLDILAHLWRYAPLTMPYGRALIGDAFAFRIMKELWRTTGASLNIYDAAISALHNVVGEVKNSGLGIVLAFDAAKSGDIRYLRPPTHPEESILARAGIEGARLLDQPWNSSSFVTSIQSLVAAHAPDAFFINLDLEPGRQIYACWYDGGRRFADVTDAFLRGGDE
jgi:hypothetical protein